MTQDTPQRLDHCFLFSLADGTTGMAFCDGRGRDANAARHQVDGVLAENEQGRAFELCYLGLLDYHAMDDSAANLLDPFEKHDPVWLAYFREKGRY